MRKAPITRNGRPAHPAPSARVGAGQYLLVQVQAAAPAAGLRASSRSSAGGCAARITRCSRLVLRGPVASRESRDRVDDDAAWRGGGGRWRMAGTALNVNQCREVVLTAWWTSALRPTASCPVGAGLGWARAAAALLARPAAATGPCCS